MQTNSLFGKKYISLEKRVLELPKIEKNLALVKVHACGVCGTDLNFVRDWDDGFQPLGHEISGEVVQVGEDVKDFHPGDTVTVEDCSMCGACTDCKSGHPQFCRNMHTLNGFPGMGEYVAVDAGNLNSNEGVPHKFACLTEPLAVALSAVNTAEIPLGGSVVVLGNGPIGLLTARVAKLRGASFVGITAHSAEKPISKARIAAAEKLGCDRVICTKTHDLEKEIHALFPKGVDRVIVTAPPKSMYDAFKIIHFGGIITFLGLSFGGGNVIDFDVNFAIFHKITLKPVFAEPAIDFRCATHLIKTGQVDASIFQTHTFGFKDAESFFRSTLEGSIPVIKPVFLPFG